MVYSLNFQWKRKTVTVTAGTALTAGHQVKLIIPKETEMQADFRDLRFETTDGYGLPHWLETVNTIPTPDEATVWVKLKEAVSGSGTVDIYMYYGNPYVASASNGANTFEFFDDFGTTVDTNKWSDIGGTNTISAGQLSTTNSNTFWRDGLQSYATFSDFILEVDAKATGNGNHGIMFRGAAADWSSGYIYRGFGDTAVILSKKTGAASYSDITSGGSGNYWGSWRKIKIKALGTSIKCYTDDMSTPLIDTTDGTNSTGSIGASAYVAGSVGLYDNFRIRKCVASEPGTPTIGSTATVNWNPRRKKITVNTITVTPVNYQVKITVPFAPEMNIDFSDLRFVSKTGTALDYWLESSTPGVTADIWIELADAIDASSSDYIYMHYGNPNLTSASNGTNTFDFFDDFSGDLSKWDTYLNVIIVSGELKILGNNAWSTTGVVSKTTFAYPIILEYKVKTSVVNIYPFVGIGDGTLDPTDTPNLALSFGVAPDINRMRNGVSSVKGSYTANTYYYAKLSVKPSAGYKVYWSISYPPTEVEDDTTWSQSTATKIVISQHSANGYSYFDDFRIRKYITTEPTIDQTAAAEAMNTFSRRKKLTINNNSGGTLTDYQVPITITYAPAMQADFDDIRFVDASGNLLPYWIEDKTDSDHAHVWIKVNLPNYGTSPVGDNIVYMYYGNSNLASASDITNMFLLYEDFESYTVGATINGVNGWVVLDSYGGGSLTTVQTDYAVSPGIKSLRVGATGSGNQRNDAVKTLPSKITDDIIVELDFRTTKPAVHSGGGDTIQWNYAGCCHIMDDAKLAAGISLGRGYAAQGDDFIWHQPDGTVITTFAINTWYKLRMDVLFSTKKSSHYINGTRYTTDVNFSDITATGITKFSSWRYSWGNAYYTWVDNIRIRKYAAVDPIVITGQEEHTRKGGILIY